MNKIKRFTILDRFRNATRAFCGKEIGSISFGIEMKKCNECDKNAGVMYLCDLRACKKCSYPICSHTTDIRHAKNFVSTNDSFWEMEDI